jgi:predicted RNase H-like HicB family nuclease
MADTKHLIIVQRTNDFHASLDGRPGVWGAGGSAAEAVGQMIIAHPGVFELIIDQAAVMPARSPLSSTRA